MPQYSITNTKQQNKSATQRQTQTQITIAGVEYTLLSDRENLKVVVELRRQYDSAYWEMVRAATEKHQYEGVYEDSLREQKIFETLRAKGMKSLRLTPREHLINRRVEHYATLSNNLERALRNVDIIDGRLSKYPPEDDIREDIKENEDYLEALKSELAEESRVEAQTASAKIALEEQRKKESEIHKYLYFLYQYWNTSSAASTRELLKTEEHLEMNATFTAEERDAVIDLLDDLFLDYCKLERNEFGASVTELNMAVKEAIDQGKFLLDTVIAVAHTIQLAYYINQFNWLFLLERDYGGVERCFVDMSIKPIGARDALQVMETMGCNFGPLYNRVKKAYYENEDEDEKFYITFTKPEIGEDRSIQQLTDRRNFLNNFWRYDNFYGFGLNSFVYLVKERYSQKEQDSALIEYIRAKREDGTHLSLR